MQHMDFSQTATTSNFIAATAVQLPLLPTLLLL
jgi:hypothetical protein